MAESEQGAVVGAQAHVNGTIRGDEDLTVLGRVDGQIQLTEGLAVLEAGIVVANVGARSVVVDGTLVGDITAQDGVEIGAAGRVVGDITAARVVLAEGAAYRGTINMGKGPARAQRASAASEKSERAASSSRTSRVPRPVAKKKASTAKTKQPSASVKAGSSKNKAKAKAKSSSRATPRPPTTAGRKGRARRR